MRAVVLTFTARCPARLKTQPPAATVTEEKMEVDVPAVAAAEAPASAPAAAEETKEEKKEKKRKRKSEAAAAEAGEATEEAAAPEDGEKKVRRVALAMAPLVLRP